MTNQDSSSSKWYIEPEPNFDPDQATPSDIYHYRNYVERIKYEGDLYLSYLIPLCIGSFVLYILLDSFLLYILNPDHPIAIVYERIWKNLSDIFVQFSFLRAFVCTLLFPCAVYFSVYYFKFRRTIKSAEQKLRLMKENYENSLLEKLDSRWSFFGDNYES